MASCVTFEYIRKNPDIRTYIQRADQALKAIGYTEHAFAHVEKTAYTAAKILTKLGYSEREVELARIAGFLHDIGNVINRADHAQSGAVMAFRLLDRLEMPVEEICAVISAIGIHGEATAQPIDAISAALILADKTDVRRSRVRNTDFLTFDIHDRLVFVGLVRRADADLDIFGCALAYKQIVFLFDVVDYRVVELVSRDAHGT